MEATVVASVDIVRMIRGTDVPLPVAVDLVAVVSVVLIVCSLVVA
ncbi:hypothetical protein AB0E04_48240 [Streptomyces sp. NPDC048251]